MRAAPALPIRRRARLALAGLAAAALPAIAASPGPGAAAAAGAGASLHMPWKAAGLSERQAAAHLLDRFAFGPRPGEVDQVVAMGLDRWLERQLAGGIPDGKLATRLAAYPALQMSTPEILRLYPLPGTVLAEARRAGVVPAKDAAAAPGVAQGDLDDKEDVKAKVRAFARERGYRPEKELLGQLMAQKVLRAVGSENQLAEVMTDFWYNHFNVSSTNNKTRPYLLAYERDAIRPHALGRFRDLLGATAHQPAMLLYLDNAQSTAKAGAETTMADEMSGRMERRAARFGRPGARALGPNVARTANGGGKRREQGLNENYARELMELHTLGVDGGYTQEDVVEVARAFTGWTVMPPGPAREQAERRLARVERAGGLGFRQQGEFLFRADAHDAGAKTILGRRFPAGRGVEEGEEVLDLLAAHPATARHLASQLAVRFVSDHPPQALVDRLAEVYRASGGDTRAMIRAIANSPEFWSREAMAAKIKSPFELAASAIRALGGEVEEPRATIEWIGRIGEPLYAYQAPTGYPDRAEAWVNTGSLLNRMNFGLQLAAGRVPGVEVDLAALNGGHEPESREQALAVYAGLLLPGRDLGPTIQLLRPMVASPDLARRVDQAAPPTAAPAAEKPAAPAARPAPPTPLQQVVGVILGSPEFQRR
jgi:uncharacterized protein (DUF1800 family)